MSYDPVRPRRWAVYIVWHDITSGDEPCLQATFCTKWAADRCAQSWRRRRFPQAGLDYVVARARF